MTTLELLNIRFQTCTARAIAYDLFQADIISVSDYLALCERYRETYSIVEKIYDLPSYADVIPLKPMFHVNVGFDGGTLPNTSSAGTAIVPERK